MNIKWFKVLSYKYLSFSTKAFKYKKKFDLMKKIITNFLKIVKYFNFSLDKCII